MRHSIHHSCRVALFLLLFSCVLGTISCGSNEPDWLIGYYMTIQSKVRLSLSNDDESQGTTPDKAVDVLSNTVRRLRTAMQEAYPHDTRTGDDVAVLSACDNIYRDYKASYADKEGYTVCTIVLYRAKKNGEVVIDNKPLTTYTFGALPQDTTSIGH